MRTWAILIPALLLAAEPFYTRPARTWSDAELDSMFESSPWTQTDSVTVWFASAGPMREAEAELLRRRGSGDVEFQRDTDFTEFLRNHGHESIVVAVKFQDQTGLRVQEEIDLMEKESRIRTGKKFLHLDGLFPPAKGDPVLRLVFPRELDPKAATVRLELYIPAKDGKAWRNFDFPVQQLMVNGKLEI